MTSKASLDAAAEPTRNAGFRPVFEAGTEAMLVLDPATDQIVDANEAAARLLGHP